MNYNVDEFYTKNGKPKVSKLGRELKFRILPDDEKKLSIICDITNKNMSEVFRKMIELEYQMLKK